MKVKYVSGHSFAHLLRNNIDISRSYAFFLMRLYHLVKQYKKLLVLLLYSCIVLVLNYFQKNFKQIEEICKKNEMFWKEFDDV